MRSKFGLKFLINEAAAAALERLNFFFESFGLSKVQTKRQRHQPEGLGLGGEIKFQPPPRFLILLFALILVYFLYYI